MLPDIQPDLKVVYMDVTNYCKALWRLTAIVRITARTVTIVFVIDIHVRI